jgi:hypothetical protein
MHHGFSLFIDAPRCVAAFRSVDPWASSDVSNLGCCNRREHLAAAHIRAIRAGP